MRRREFRSHWTLWFVEATLAFNMAYIALDPILRGRRNPADADGIESYAENFLTGWEADTSAFWVRMFAVAISLGVLFCFPTERNPRRMLKTRVKLNFFLFVLFTYAFFLSLIFTTITDFLWVQMLVYALLMGVAYISNSWWLRHGR